MQKYDYDIIDRSSSNMKHVDALSRLPIICALGNENNNFERALLASQMLDSRIEEIRIQLENREYKNFELRDGVVYRKNKDSKLLFYVPQNMINQILKMYHDDFEHFGVEKVYDLINKSYWFPNMKEQIKKYINTV